MTKGSDDRAVMRRRGGSASGRARNSGDRIALAAYLGGSDTFAHALAHFDQNERHYQAWQSAANTGRVETVRGT